VILSANYTFLTISSWPSPSFSSTIASRAFAPQSWRAQLAQARKQSRIGCSASAAAPAWQQTWARSLATLKLALTAVMFIWLFYFQHCSPPAHDLVFGAFSIRAGRRAPAFSHRDRYASSP